MIQPVLRLRFEDKQHGEGSEAWPDGARRALSSCSQSTTILYYTTL